MRSLWIAQTVESGSKKKHARNGTQGYFTDGTSVNAERLLTLGAHAPEGYGSCRVCVSVSVRNLNLGTGASRGLNKGTSE